MSDAAPAAVPGPAVYLAGQWVPVAPIAVVPDARAHRLTPLLRPVWSGLPPGRDLAA